jgi:CRISPR-associated protein Cas1
MWGWRTVVVGSEVSLCLANGNLHLKKPGEAISLPISDIDMILFENVYGNISLPLLRALMEKGIGVIILDGSMMPTGVFLPFATSSNHSGLLFSQLSLKVPFKKQVWQRIVKQKIYNQALVLKILGIRAYKELCELEKKVKSGDADNREAYAAKIYFNALYPGFARKEENALNAALNYGYAIVRSALARSFFATGLVCALGIKHSSKTNPFNLVDDFLEAYRPFVDLLVFSNPPRKELIPEYKRYLTGVLRLECLLLSRTFTVSNAAWRTAQSYAKAVKEKNSELIELPQVDELSFRSLEE